MGASESRAVVLTAPRKVEVRRLPIPVIGDDDALLRVEATGLCGTDLAGYKGDIRLDQIPYILGHEVIGRIEAIGPAAAKRWGVSRGDRVAVEEYLPCGYCGDCLAGQYQMCTAGRYGGTTLNKVPALWGGFSDYMYLPANALVHRLDSDLSPEVAQLFIPIANGIYWASEVGRVGVGATVVVVGPGAHGLGSVIGARESGAGCVILVGRSLDQHRLAVGRALGADHTLSIDEDDIVARVAEITGGKMADVVINTASSATAASAALQVAGKFGVVVQVSITGETAADFPIDLLTQKCLTIKGVKGRPTRTVPVALRLMASGRYPVERICSHRFSLDQTEAALHLMERGAEGLCRIAIVSGGGQD